jgi:N-acetylmuramic acid 6-phosphate etherase
LFKTTNMDRMNDRRIQQTDSPPSSPHFLAIEGGGTKSSALAATADGRVIERLQAGPLNLKLSDDAAVVRLLRRFSAVCRRPRAVGLFLAGCRTPRDHRRVRELAGRVFPRATIVTGSDLDCGMAAAFGPTGAGILVINGTGSVVVGRDNSGRIARAGGWGHLLGDHGSGYWIALTGLRNAIREYDRHGRMRSSLRLVLQRLSLHSTDALVDWIHGAGKDEVAALAGDVLKGDHALMLQAASFLAQDAHAVAKQLGLESPPIALDGGMLRHHPALRRWTTHRLRQFFPSSPIACPRTASVTGALMLLRARVGSEQGPGVREIDGLPVGDLKLADIATERRNPRTMNLDKRSVSELVDLMLDEESRVIPAIRRQSAAIVKLIGRIVSALGKGGRLFYVGAGTSGRIGVLDASECPPTFSTEPEMVQAIIAGGAAALSGPAEAAEDDPQAGADVIRLRAVGKKDVVVGIAASGRTPYVLGALDAAKKRGATTCLLCFSEPATKRHLTLQIGTGPEFVTGSTRLKAGTATKLVLNMLTTISMIRLGKVVDNLMVDVKPTNAKLRDRACRIVMTLTGCAYEQALERLVRTGWNVKGALR